MNTQRNSWCIIVPTTNDFSAYEIIQVLWQILWKKTPQIRVILIAFCKFDFILHIVLHTIHVRNVQ